VHAHTVAGGKSMHLLTHVFDHTCRLVPERDRALAYRRSPGPVVGIRVADAGCPYAY
jgi:hypothetical protein